MSGRTGVSDGHHDPNELHPALLALRDVLEEIRGAVHSASVLPAVMDGPLISIPMDTVQKAQVDAQLRTLRGVERMIVEQYPGVIE